MIGKKRFVILSSAGMVLGACVACAGVAIADENTAADAGSGGHTQSTEVYSGTDFAKDAQGYFAGATMAFNGDLARSGPILKIEGGISNYEYASDSVVGGIVDGDGYVAGVLVGYHLGLGQVDASLAVGADYHDEQLSPDDPTAVVNGTEVGFIASGDLAFSGSNLSLSLAGIYSTAFDSYWSRARFGYDSDCFAIGPEALAFGVDGYDARRLGGFATIKFNLTPSTEAELTLSVGHQFVAQGSTGGDVGGTGGGEGTYVTIGTGLSF